MRGIVAMSLGRVIGLNGQLPWAPIKEDMGFFKKMTSNPVDGGYLLMGRKTFDSVGILPGRLIYILTNDKRKRGLLSKDYRYLTEDEFHSLTRPFFRTWVCGGSSVYEKFLPQCLEVFVTIVLDEYEGDTYLPYFENYFPNSEVIMECKTHWRVRYWK